MGIDPRGGHNRKKINENFFKKWSPEMAYVLGLIYADGSLIDSRLSSRTCYVIISNNDLDLLKQVKNTMGSKHTLEVRSPYLRKIRKKEYQCRTSYRLRIGSRLVYDDLLKLGLTPRKSLSIKLPDIPIEYFSYFTRGYCDGDGCVNVYKKSLFYRVLKVIFVSGSFEFLKQLSYRLGEILGTKLKTVFYQSEAYRIVYSTKEARILCDFMYRDINLAPFLKRKYKKFYDYEKFRVIHQL